MGHLLNRIAQFLKKLLESREAPDSRSILDLPYESGIFKGNDGGVLLWFSIDVISHAGRPDYGRYVFEWVLPLFSPPPRKSITEAGVVKSPARYGTRYVLFDGDLLGAHSIPINNNVAEEAECMKRVLLAGGGGMVYILGIYGNCREVFPFLDQALRKSEVTGYLGMTSVPPSLAEFLVLMRRLSLCHALSVTYSGTVEMHDFDFFGPEDLEQMGFRNVVARAAPGKRMDSVNS